jgi:hypothetical protein
MNGDRRHTVSQLNPHVVAKAAAATSALTAAVALVASLIPDVSTITAKAYRAGVEDRPDGLSRIRR